MRIAFIILLVQQGNIFPFGRQRNRFQIRVDVCQVLVRQSFACVWWHLVRGMTDVTDESFERKYRRAYAGGSSLRGALALEAVAFVAAIAREILLAVLCVPGAGSIGSGLLGPR